MINVAMIFAAGRGERMRPLTDHTPKPLLEVSGKSLIQHQIEALARAGITDVVINYAWLGEQIPQKFGDGRQFGLRLHYSAETEALETAGGIAKALPILKAVSMSHVFLAVSGDVYTKYNYQALLNKDGQMPLYEVPKMHLIMVDNPDFHPEGDFVLDQKNQMLLPKQNTERGRALTFGNIGLYDMRWFESIESGQRVAMTGFYQQAIKEHAAFGEHYEGVWENVGTPDQLQALNEKLLKV